MNLKMEIICENFEQKKIIDDKIIVDNPTEEYYVILLNKSYDLETDCEIFKLIFFNQQLLLKYSNMNNEILIKNCDFEDCVIIKSDLIKEIYVELISTDCFRKNVWHYKNSVYMNKKYLDDYFLVIPIIDDMIDIFEYGEGIRNYQVKMITNEVLLRRVCPKGNNHGYIGVTNNVLMNKDALFVRLGCGEEKLFTI